MPLLLKIKPCWICWCKICARIENGYNGDGCSHRLWYCEQVCSKKSPKVYCKDFTPKNSSPE